MKKIILSMLVLLVAVVTGAWADETLLLTIESKDYKTFTSGSKNFDDMVTITFSSSVDNDASFGWYATSPASLLTVAGTNGYTITSCKFYAGYGPASTGYTIKGESPSVYLSEGYVYTDANQSENIGAIGVTKIEVYGAAASGYSVSLKEGTEDADKWTGKAGAATDYQALPLNVVEGAAVSLKFDGTRRVKSVKAVKKAAKPDLLPAVFTVDAGKTVKFSKGNLQATYNGSNWIWGFAEHQWDYIGNTAGNTSINGNGTVSANGTVDLFGWVGASSTWTGAAQYGISNSTATNNVDGYGNVGGEAQKVGWGATVGAGWRTLTKNEWLYLLSERATGVTVNSTDNARYTQATINTDGTAVKGLIIFPDSYAGGSPAGVTWGTINAKSTFETTCTSAGWTALEAAGCVFLPAAGYRQASNVTDAGIGGGYWSSSSSTAPYAFALYFESDYMTIQYGGSRKYGFSVRLVRDAN